MLHARGVTMEIRQVLSRITDSDARVACPTMPGGRIMKIGGTLVALALAAGAAGCRIAEDASSEPGEIRGRLVDVDGNPLENGELEIRVAGNESFREQETAARDGEFALEDLHQAPYDLAFTA